MPLPSFDKQADIPKGFEDEYEEHEGKWVPIDRSAKIMRALEEERSKREAAEKLVTKAAREVAEAQARRDATASGMTEEEFRKKYKAIEDNIRAEYEPKIREAETLANENRTLKLTNVVKEKFRANGALKEKVDDFWKLHGDEFDLSVDGKPVVKAEPGKDLDKHVAGIIKHRSEWMQGTKARGGGAGGLSSTLPTGSGQGGAVTFEDLVKNPGAAVAQANQ